jgi:excinuclease ABC subunit A
MDRSRFAGHTRGPRQVGARQGGKRMEPRIVSIKGAREHNLRGVSLDLPRNRLICFTGVSGSGKSSLAFDTLYAEGQRRYLESLSSYARQFLGQLAKPDVDQISGLSPSVSIQQKAGGWNPRSTAATVTQIHDYLRVLYARVGTQHCPRCGQPISAQSREQIIGRILTAYKGRAVLVLAPVVRGQKGEFRDLFEELIRKGFVRARVDGAVEKLSEAPALGKNLRHDIEVVVDRLTVQADGRARLAEAVDNALRLGEQTVLVAPHGREGGRGEGRPGETLFSSQHACTQCGLSFQPLSPQLFSFNSPVGMCVRCDGLGTRFDFDPELLVPEPSRPFLRGAIITMRTPIGRWRRHIYEGVARHIGFDLRQPWNRLPARARQALLYGTADEHITFEWRSRGGIWRHGGTFAGVIAELSEKYRKARSNIVRSFYEKYMRRAVCAECGGERLNSQARAVRVGGRTLPEVERLSVQAAARFFAELELEASRQVIAEEVLKEIRARLEFLTNVGLDYLTLDRSAPTLSGGESQRIRLASQIGSGLVGVLYVLDEPSIGLHARDNRRLLDSLLRLRDAGNTVIVVEHDEETMRSADLIVDFGPGPGVRGGEIVAVGDVEELASNQASLTGRYLAGQEEIAVPQVRRPVNGKGPGNGRGSPPAKRKTVRRKATRRKR